MHHLCRDPLREALAFTRDRKSTRLNSSHRCISYAVFCLKKKKITFLNDDTTGCTLEECGFRDAYMKFQIIRPALLGITTPPHDSHTKFESTFVISYTYLL